MLVLLLSNGKEIRINSDTFSKDDAHEIIVHLVKLGAQTLRGMTLWICWLV